MDQPIRVVQWTTGITGESSVRAILDDPRFELVGVFAHGEKKVGVDAGDLVGRPATGVLATGDVDALLALKPDCVAYMPRWPDIDELARILRAGVNVVTTARVVTGARYPNGDRLDAAARDGGVSLYGTGCSPMHVENVAIAAGGLARDITHIEVIETIDGMMYGGTESWEAYGFGGPADADAVRAALIETEPDYPEMMDVMAASAGVTLDDIALEVEVAAANEDRELPFMTIAKGTMAAFKSTFTGSVNGHPFVTFRQLWHLGAFAGYTAEPSWPLTTIGHDIHITGEPNVNLHIDCVPPDIFNMDIGLPVALPALNAIPAVCAARPGVVTILDIPVPTGQAASQVNSKRVS